MKSLLTTAVWLGWVWLYPRLWPLLLVLTAVWLWFCVHDGGRTSSQPKPR